MDIEHDFEHKNKHFNLYITNEPKSLNKNKNG